MNSSFFFFLGDVSVISCLSRSTSSHWLFVEFFVSLFFFILRFVFCHFRCCQNEVYIVSSGRMLLDKRHTQKKEREREGNIAASLFCPVYNNTCTDDWWRPLWVAIFISYYTPCILFLFAFTTTWCETSSPLHFYSYLYDESCKASARDDDQDYRFQKKKRKKWSGRGRSVTTIRGLPSQLLKPWHSAFFSKRDKITKKKIYIEREREKKETNQRQVRSFLEGTNDQKSRFTRAGKQTIRECPCLPWVIRLDSLKDGSHQIMNSAAPWVHYSLFRPSFSSRIFIIETHFTRVSITYGRDGN